MFMLWYVKHFRIPASHGISGVHLFTDLHLLLCWLVCGMEAVTLLSDIQRCPLKLSRLHHNLDIACCLVLISCFLEFTWNWFLFLIINNRRERVYWEGRDKISKLGNNFLHESLLLQPIMILLIFFCTLKILIWSGEFPQNINLLAPELFF